VDNLRRHSRALGHHGVLFLDGMLAVRRGAPHSPSQTEAGISVDSSPAGVAWTPALNRVGSQPGPFGCDSSNWIRRVASKITPRLSLRTTRTSIVSGSVKAAWLTLKKGSPTRRLSHLGDWLTTQAVCRRMVHMAILDSAERSASWRCHSQGMND
jgi:hypothetical protein